MIVLLAMAAPFLVLLVVWGVVRYVRLSLVWQRSHRQLAVLQERQCRSYLLLDDPANLAETISEMVKPGFLGHLYLYRCYSCGMCLALHEHEHYQGKSSRDTGWQTMTIDGYGFWVCPEHARQVKELLGTLTTMS